MLFIAGHKHAIRMNTREVNKRIETCINTKSKSLDLSGLEISDLNKLIRLNECSHIESLSLSSNQISKIENLDQLNQLTSLSLSSNQISKIENLDQLNQLTSLSLSSNQISKIENLDRLNELTELYLSSNQISKIENLDKLNQLTELYLSSNQISKIENLDQLNQLTSLSLSSNQISKIENLGKLNQLTELYLSSNQISKIENLAGIQKCKSLKRLYINENPFLLDSDVVLEANNNHFDVVNNLLLQFDSSENNMYEYPAKLVVLGNHAMGKSNLVEYLVSDSITPLQNKPDDQRSTHGLRVIPLSFADKSDSFPDAMIYDFGGQDYYHGLYRSYLNYGSNYIILWKPQKAKCLQNKDNTGLNNYYFDVQYWMGQKVYYDSSTYNEGERGFIFLLQGYADEIAKQRPDLGTHRNQEIESVHICLSPDHIDNYKEELALLKKNIKNRIHSQKQSAQKASWYKKFINYIYNQLTTESYNPVQISSLASLFEEGDLSTELNQLHNKGLIIYFQEVLPDLVWLNPSSFSEYVWSKVLPKDKLIAHKGRLPASEVEQFSNELEVLKQQRIIFHYQKDNIYLVPNFLEAAPVNDSNYSLLVEDFGESAFVLYFQHFVPIPIINQAICHFGNHNDAEFWKDELRFTLKNECKVRIYFDIKAFTISIFLAKKGDKDFDRQLVMAYLFHCLMRMYWNIPILESFETFSNIRRYILNNDLSQDNIDKFPKESESHSFEFEALKSGMKSKALPGDDKYGDVLRQYDKVRFEEIANIYTNKNYWPSDLYICVDGAAKVSYKELSATINGSEDLSKYQNFNALKIESNTTTRVSISGYQPFVGHSLNATKDMKNIFICYASQDLKYKNELLKFLRNPERQGKIKIWQDHVLNPGDDWDDQIKQNLKEADIVIVLVSQDAVISRYINEEEMTITLARHKNGEVRLFPVLVRPTDFHDWTILPADAANAAMNEEVNMGKFQFFPKVEGRLKALSGMSDYDLEKTWLDLKKILMEMIQS